MALDLFHATVSTWFRERFVAPTPAQAAGWREIATGHDTLIMAPTGSGKTLAAFLAGLDRLVRDASRGELKDETRIVYVSPLKALGADVERNLLVPLSGIDSIATRLGYLIPPIRTGLRTGDSTSREREKVLRRPPHVLITTPESLYLLLTANRGRQLLSSADTVIIDEIHALIGGKRGAHLALSLERLDALCGRRLQRVGLSATIESPDEAARFLVGYYASGEPRSCQIVDAGRRQSLDVAIEVPDEALSAVASRRAWEDVYIRIAELTRSHRSTIIFVSSRRLAERVAHDLEAKLGKEAVAAHHGALSRRTRQLVERRLQTGELRVVVATASLELGIDIGHVELVCQIGSPRAISVLRQRIGRAHHAFGGTPKGRIFALTRDELIECAAAVRAMRAGLIDRPLVRDQPLDILAQQLVATAAAGEWDEAELFTLVRQAAPYARLPRDEFDDILTVLNEGIATRRGRAGAHVHRDRVRNRVRARRGARLAALTSGGAIPDKADYAVVEEPSETVVGTLDEDFAIESMAGDIFLLGSQAWRIRRVESGKVRVEDAHGAPPSVPFWNGEGLSRTLELSTEVARLREEIAVRAGSDSSATEKWLMEACALDASGAAQAVAYILEGQRALAAVPTQRCLIAERFFDESGGMQLVLHAPFGARINRAWGLALRKRFCRTFDFELQAAATDDAILLSLGPQHSFPLESIFGFLHPHTVEETLLQAALQSPMWETRWRWNVTRALAVLRHSQGRRTPPPLLRMRAADLLAAVFPAQAGCQDNHGGGDLEVPDHPLVNETVRDCLREAMDTDGLTAILEQMHANEIVCLARDTVTPSPFSHAILHANPYAFLDDAPLEERRTRAISVARPGELVRDLRALDLWAISDVIAEARMEPRDPDELHDFLCTLGIVEVTSGVTTVGSAEGLSASTQRWPEWLALLRVAGRATRVIGLAEGEWWAAAERLELLRAAYGPGLSFDPELPPVGSRRTWDLASSAVEIVGAYLRFSGPQTADEIANSRSLPRATIDMALAQLESDGQILQGRFRARAVGDVEWCERGLLQRIHRKTLSRKRAEVRPVAVADFLRFLFRWQHVAPHTQLHGREGLLKTIEQLEGLELPAAAWERDVLPARVAGYRPEWLDELCLSGEVAWARLRVEPPEAADEEAPGTTSRTRGTRGAVGLFLRAHATWLIDPYRKTEDPPSRWAHLSDSARRVAAELERRGAAFVVDLATSLGCPLADIEDALWELVRTGAVSSDGFGALRALLLSSIERRGRPSPAGRFSLLHREAVRRTGEEGPFFDGTPVELAKLYLRRYGVVIRDLLARETTAPPWRELLFTYRRLEARGEIRGGRFVAGFSGEQFALPEAMEALALLRPPAIEEEQRIAATDPLNLVGILTLGPRVPSNSNQSILFQDGVPQVAIRSLASWGSQ
jgi:ATP-dependent Lhr-like helicase